MKIIVSVNNQIVQKGLCSIIFESVNLNPLIVEDKLQLISILEMYNQCLLIVEINHLDKDEILFIEILVKQYPFIKIIVLINNSYNYSDINLFNSEKINIIKFCDSNIIISKTIINCYKTIVSDFILKKENILREKKVLNCYQKENWKFVNY